MAEQISPGIANLLNMHPDEMLARVGNKDTELPNSDLEFFCTIICNSSPSHLPPPPPLLLLFRCFSAAHGFVRRYHLHPPGQADSLLKAAPAMPTGEEEGQEEAK